MAPFNGKKVDTWKGAITEIERVSQKFLLLLHCTTLILQKLRFEIDQSSTKVMEEVEKINKKVNFFQFVNFGMGTNFKIYYILYSNLTNFLISRLNPSIAT